MAKTPIDDRIADEISELGGAFVDAPEEESEGIEEVPGAGGAFVDEDPDAEPGRSLVDEDPDHWENLALKKIEPTRLTTYATELLELVKTDKKSREERDKKYAEGLKRTGLGDEAPGGAQFNGASRVVHPLLIESSIDFASRAMKETFPASGPAKTYIPGTPNKEKMRASASSLRSSRRNCSGPRV